MKQDYSGSDRHELYLPTKFGNFLLLVLLRLINSLQFHLLAFLPFGAEIEFISILQKMRFEPTSFHMDVKGERADDHPKQFTTIHIHYALEGELLQDKVVRAVKLSTEKYCSVSHSLNAEITASYSINGVKGTQEV